MKDETSSERAKVLRQALLEIRDLRAKVEEYDRVRSEPVAIVGVGCRFPGHVTDPESFWRLLIEGTDAVTDIPQGRWDSARYYDPDPNAAGNKMYTRRGGFIDGVKEFDAAFFGITPREAATLDPQQRLLLEVSWEALENGGIAPETLVDSDTGVFVGMCGFDYPQLLLGDKSAPIDGYMGSGSTHSAASGRLSYFLGIRGPCMSIDTACSSSLVSVHLAIQSLRSGECGIALAGGVNLLLIPETTIIFSKAKMMSPEGICRTFDAKANGYVRGEGCGMVVLKRLSDAERDGDSILAVIRGSAVNQDGRSAGLTVPNGTAQEEVLRAALRNAGVEPAKVCYVEAHGTGTSLGDPIELRALSAVLNDCREMPLAVGSVKTNFGHLEGAAGIASLIKTALALQHRTIPPHLHFETPNPFFDWERSGLAVPAHAMPLEGIDGRRIAGVSSFGFSGTNGHVILEEAPAAIPARSEFERSAHVLTLSARTETALEELRARYLEYLASRPARFEDICFTANAGRSHFTHRIAIVAKNKEEAISRLRDAAAARAVRPKITFIFEEEAGNCVEVGRSLYNSNPDFHDFIDRIGWAHFASESPDGPQACFLVVECGLIEMWRSWGVEPAFNTGRSTGEYAATVSAGLMDFDGALKALCAGSALPINRSETPQSSGCDISIEIGPRAASDWVRICESIASLYLAGVPVDWRAFDRGYHRARVPVPLYPFQRETWWVEKSPVERSEAPVPDEITLTAADPFFGDHRVSGRCLLPAAAYVTMALRHSAGVVEDLRLHQPVILTDKPSTVRFAFSDQAFQVFTSDTLHAEGRIAPAETVPSPSGFAEIERIRANSTKSSPRYEDLASKGLGFGPAFRSITALWRSERRVVAEIALPAETSRKSTVLLDACFQVGGSLIEQGELAIPTRVDRVWVDAGDSIQAFCLASRNRMTAFDERGTPIAVIDGLHFSHPERKIRTDWLYEIVWERPDLPVDRTALADHLRRQVEPLNAKFGTEAWEKILPELEDLSRVWARRALETLGENFQPAPRHQRLMERLREIARESAVEHPPTPLCAGSPAFTVLQRCGESLPGILCGETDPLDVLFPGGSSEFLEQLYRDLPFAHVASELVKAVFKHLAAAAPADRLIRILEIGAGTGSATEAALQGLSAGRIDYLFTDISAGFGAPAKKKFADYTGLRYGVLDIEKHPDSQGFSSARFDVVLAANVFHATAGLRETIRHARALLMPGGMLALVESSGRQNWVDLIFGLTEGWWKFADSDLRPDHPLLSMDRWRSLLANEGFDDVTAVCTHGDPDSEPNQAVILAYRSNDAQTERDIKVYAGALDAHTPEDSLRVCGEVLELVRTLDALPDPPRLCLVTSSASNPASAAVSGMGNAIALEHPDLSCVRVDVDKPDTDAVKHAIETDTAEDRIAIRDGITYVARLRRTTIAENPSRIRFRANGTYVIAGGFGDLGLETAHWMVDRGARNLLLVGRNHPTAAVQAKIETLRSSGAAIVAARVDISRVSDLRRCFDEASKSMPPIRGIIHSAGELSDGMLSQQNVAGYRDVFEPKIFGAWNLHQLTLGQPLDFFVLYSSAAAILGSPAQSNHCAANACLDALAHHRRAVGLPALSINWGIWSEIGAAARLGAASGKHGLGRIPPAEGFAILEALMLDPQRAQVAVLPIRWDRFLAAYPGVAPPFFTGLVQQTGEMPSPPSDKPDFAASVEAQTPGQRRLAVHDHVRETVARVIGQKDSARIDPRQPLSELGLDSLMAIELRNRLEKDTALALHTTLLFDYPSIDTLAEFLASMLPGAGAEKDVKPTELPPPPDHAEPIAIVGMACRFPGGASNPEEFRRLLLSGFDAVTEVPAERWNIDEFYDPEPGTPGTMSTRYGAFLRDIDRFDPHLFGIAPREAESLDPQQRLLLEISWEALEDAGYAPDSLSATPAGVFIGLGLNEYAQLALDGDVTRIDPYLTLGSTPSAAAGRISYTFGLRGPSMVVDTACSSSLVAVHLACASLRSNDCALALAAAANLILSPQSTIALSSLRMMASDGHCKTFDASADGFVRGEGCGVVVLKRLSAALKDGDRIHAIIRGSSVNQDGRSGGFTAPNGVAQQALIKQALENAGVSAAQVGYVEAHGTGTPLGDPIELQALSAVMSEGRSADKPLPVGSVKTNIGHLEAAAGIAGLIKTVFVLRDRVIPPHLHLRNPNPFIPWEQLCIEVPREPVAFHGRFAGVSSFGATGTNAHVVLEEAPGLVPKQTSIDRPMHVLTLSARSGLSLEARRQAMIAAATDQIDFPDLCYTANAGRSHFAHRIAIVADSAAQAREKLFRATAAEAVGKPRIAFLFSGQGSQYTGMARGIYEIDEEFRDVMDRASAIAGQSFFEASLDQTQFTQPFLYALEYGLARIWRRWGIEPAAVMGHSVGEFAAAAVAGLFSFEDGLRLIAERGRLMQNLPAGGAMMAVIAPESHVIGYCGADLSIAALNGPESVVLSGEAEAVAKAQESLSRKGIRCERLRVSHAFHSALMDSMLPALSEAAERIPFRNCDLPLVSNVTGRIAWDEELKSPGYWVRHARGAVQFHGGVQSLRDAGVDTYLEIGPHPVLVAMARETLGENAVFLPSLRRGRGDWGQISSSLAELYTRGADVDWKAFDAGRSRRKISLPTYPFNRQRYWFSAAPRPKPERTRTGTHTLLGRALRSPELTDRVYESEFDAARFSEHRIFGNAVAPAAAWIEMLCAAGGGRQIRNLVLHEPLVLLPGEPVTVQTILRPDSFRIVSLRGEEWVTHASGSLADTPPVSPARFSFPSIDEDAAPRYTEVQARGIELGPSFRWIDRLHRGNREAWGSMRASRSEDRADRYGVHPGLIDSCIQMLGAAAPPEAVGDDLFIPASIGSIRLPRKADAISFCFARIHEAGNGTLTGEVRLLDSNGDEVGAIENLQLRRLPRAAIMYEVAWKPAEAPGDSIPGQQFWIICGDREIGQALRDELERRGSQAVLALDGGTFAGAVRALQNLTGRLAIVTRAASLDQAPLRGLANTIALERPELDCRSIETDSNDAVLLANTLLRDDPESRMAIINGAPCVARLRRLRLPHRDQFSARANASYLITGGMGGLGLATAHWLWSKGAKHIALVGRSVTAAGDPFRRFSGDVSQRADVDRILHEIASSMPPLAGIIHAAGVLDDGLLSHQTPERFDRVMAPKALGACHLHEATKSAPLDFFILYSSVASILGSAGQGNYAAANSYLDTLAHHRHSLGLPAISVNWGPWAETGMAARAGSNRRLESSGFKPMRAEAAFPALELAMTAGLAQVAIFEADWTRRQSVPPFLSELLPQAVQPGFLQTLRAADARRQAALLRAHVRGTAERILGRGKTDPIPDNGKFFDLGMDSLMGLELKNALQSSLECRLPSTLAFEYPNVAALSDFLAETLGLTATTEPVADETNAADPTLSMIEEISEDDAEALLGEKLRALEELEISL
jgi:acyl transferase domain-containing protein/acyl carrier protein